MKLAVLFSGGKDSTLATYWTQQKEEVSLLISVISENEDSYMFHTPNIEITKIQAQAMGIPILLRTTQGRKEEELNDLEEAVIEAKRKGVKGIVTGAIESVYQASRVQAICSRQGLWCFNPLWKMDQEKLLRELVNLRFKVMITGISAYPLTREWLGRIIDEKTIDELMGLKNRIGINPAGEGGEIETTVIDCPLFKRKISVIGKEGTYSNYSGKMRIKAVLR